MDNDQNSTHQQLNRQATREREIQLETWQVGAIEAGIVAKQEEFLETEVNRTSLM